MLHGLVVVRSAVGADRGGIREAAFFYAVVNLVTPGALNEGARGYGCLRSNPGVEHVGAPFEEIDQRVVGWGTY